MRTPTVGPCRARGACGSGGTVISAELQGLHDGEGHRGILIPNPHS